MISTTKRFMELSPFFLLHTDSLLDKYLPGGSLIGAEYVAPHPFGKLGTLNLVIVDTLTGEWEDFLGAKGDDLLSLISYLKGVSTIQMLAELTMEWKPFNTLMLSLKEDGLQNDPRARRKFIEDVLRNIFKNSIDLKERAKAKSFEFCVCKTLDFLFPKGYVPCYEDDFSSYVLTLVSGEEAHIQKSFIMTLGSYGILTSRQRQSLLKKLSLKEA